MTPPNFCLEGIKLWLHIETGNKVGFGLSGFGQGKQLLQV